VQYAAYWFVLYEEIFALALFIFVFLLIEKGSLWAMPLGILIPMSNQTVTIALLGVLFFFSIFNKDKRLLAGTVFLDVLIIYLFLHPNVQKKSIRLR